VDTAITASADGLTDGFGAFDLMLLSVFFISYSVAALVQVNNLFNDRYAVFGGLVLIAFLASRLFGMMDYTSFCAETNSALVCRNGGRGLVALATMWIYVSFAMLFMFGCVCLIRAFRSR
jgi:hypothetical protein